MGTIGASYDPIIKAHSNPEEFSRLLYERTDALFRENPSRFMASRLEASAEVVENVRQYSRHFDDAIIIEVDKLLVLFEREREDHYGTSPAIMPQERGPIPSSPYSQSLAVLDGKLCRGDVVFDMKALIDAKFAGETGALAFDKDTPDEIIVAAVRHALSFGTPFTVMPA